MLISLNNVGVRFEQWGQINDALIDINVEVNAGEWVMITGHNGSGKSTLLKVIGGQVELASGSVKLAHPKFNERASHFASGVFHVRQDPLLGTASLLTLRENLTVALPVSSSRIAHKGRRRLVEEALDVLEMRKRASQLLRDFSGGERQQVALAIARLRRPELLLLDEPLAALDPQRLSAAMSLITELSSCGTTILQVTHDPSMAFHEGNRTLMMENGRLVSDLTGADRSLRQTSNETTASGAE